ncbi:MAG: dTDP-glucose 4,6-dehydratase [Desulfovibrio sp.]|jgi:dTDP-glucose 4,6-dehydratase|nr:dTDP-glucose 4,6-dehydratase [Desulfovibrio sp.]
MRLLVTGGCGFIGSNFIRMVLRDRPDVVVCNMDNLGYAGNPANLALVEREYPGRYFFERADIADADAARGVMRGHRIEALVNFAAESHVDRSIEDASPFVRSNVLGVVVLLQAALEAKLGRFVQVSTDEVYGSLPLEARNAAFTEDSPLAPNSPYSASKASADLFCRAFFKTHGLPLVITRCSNNYGPYQFPEKLIPFMFFRAMRDEPLPVYGDGQNVRDWIHVEDHCRGVLMALEKGRDGTVYNFGGGAQRSNLYVVREILKFCGKDESLIRPVRDRPGHDRRYAVDYSLAAAELGFSPGLGFEEGLSRTLAWYRENSDWVGGATSGSYLYDMRKRYGE